MALDADLRYAERRFLWMIIGGEESLCRNGHWISFLSFYRITGDRSVISMIKVDDPKGYEISYRNESRTSSFYQRRAIRNAVDMDSS